MTAYLCFAFLNRVNPGQLFNVMIGVVVEVLCFRRIQPALFGAHPKFMTMPRFLPHGSWVPSGSSQGTHSAGFQHTCLSFWQLAWSPFLVHCPAFLCPCKCKRETTGFLIERLRQPQVFWITWNGFRIPRSTDQHAVCGVMHTMATKINTCSPNRFHNSFLDTVAVRNRTPNWYDRMYFPIGCGLWDGKNNKNENRKMRWVRIKSWRKETRGNKKEVE